MSAHSVNLPGVTSRHRAEPLPPEQRRLVIVRAVTPLLVDQGGNVTTRQLAEAAGVAEGTLFGVFADKRELIHHAIEKAMDPEPVYRGFSEIHRDAPLETQMAEAARILLERFDEVITLLGVLHTLPATELHHRHDPPPFVAEFNSAVMEVLTDLFGRNRDRLRMEPARAATAFKSLLFARAHPSMALDEKLTVDEIVQVLISGISRPVGTSDLTHPVGAS